MIRSSNPEKLKAQYEQLGMKFDYHKHGEGPLHYSSTIDGLVLEIYPLKKSQPMADKSLRLGFEIRGVDNFFEMIKTVKTSGLKIISEPTESEWGRVGIIQDLDGRKIELKELEL